MKLKRVLATALALTLTTLATTPTLAGGWTQETAEGPNFGKWKFVTIDGDIVTDLALMYETNGDCYYIGSDDYMVLSIMGTTEELKMSVS